MNTSWLDIGNGLKIGFHNGQWAVFAKNGIYPLKEEVDFSRIVSLLEKTLHEVSVIVSSVEHTFPFGMVIKAGLASASDYWAGLALVWLVELSEDEKVNFFDQLAAVSEAKWASQKTRQIAKREIKYLQAM